MCEPVTIAIAATAIGSAIAAQGQYETDKANERVLEFQEETTRQQADAEAAALESQAKEDDFRAFEAKKRGRLRLNRFRGQVQRDIGETKTALAVSGVEISTGSARRVLDDQARAGAMDEIILSQNNALETWGFKTAAAKLRAGAERVRLKGRAQAELFAQQAKIIGKAADLRRTTSILSGFGQAGAIAGGLK